MPWASTRPAGKGTNPKYQTPEYRRISANYKRSIKAGQTLTCTARECQLPTRDITNPNGDDDDGVTVGHADNGIDIDGPQHRVCNSRDGSARGRARQDEEDRWVL